MGLGPHLVRSWKYFWYYIGVNLLLFSGYMAYVITGELAFLGQDQYGIARLMTLFALPLINSVVAFPVALDIHKKDQQQA